MEAARVTTLADFVAFEDASPTKHELVNGVIVAMAGASMRHNAIAMNIGAALHLQLRAGDCRPYSSDQRVHVLRTDLDTYPDVVVICGAPILSPDDRHAVTNPTLLVEVLSPSTERYDRGAKWLHYQQLPTLREYLLVASEGEPTIERFFRGDDGGWRYDVVRGEAAVMKLASCAASLSIDDAYAKAPAE
ncbi:MAG: Uma2 family endonuclease [Polyangiales bacterium]